VTADTLPKLLLHNAEAYGDRPAFREKGHGIWRSWSWCEASAEVRAMACGLAALGFERGDRLAIIGDNRPHLYWAMTAAQCLGGVPVPVYQDSVANEMRFVLEHAEARFAAVENQEQVDKLLEIRGSLPTLEAVVFRDSRGMRDYDHDFLHSMEEMGERGRAYDRAHHDFFMAEVERGQGGDVASFYYTSGTTGDPKGVVATFDNIIMTARAAATFEGLGADEQVLSYLPMAWVGDNIFSVAQQYCAGFCINCPESSDTLLHDLFEIGPTYFFAPPRIWENLLTTVMIRMEDAGWLKRKMFHFFMSVARRSGAKILDRQSAPAIDRVLYALGRFLVYGPLKNVLGFSGIRLAYTAGEAIGPDIFKFYRSLGINIKQLYGSTEASVFVTIQPDGEVKDDTVGKPIRGVELRVADSGEIMFKSPGVFQEYYKDPQATAETKTPDGWVHTGDAGFVGDDGHLRIIDRANDVGKLNDGTMLAPKFIENKLKFFPHIKEAVAFGDGRDYATVFIAIDLEAVGNWAERQRLPYASYAELAAKPEVYDLLADEVAQVNRDLAAEERLVGSQVKRFLLLHKELDADDGELTRTGKVRRRIVAERYGTLIDALYSDVEHCAIETQVTFEDGRTDTVRADLAIREAERFDHMRAAG
jgi:long-chain acyl-CoA synthetase